ncbi:MAG TPA: cytochrome ubiquinol oxidase subunit I [Anaerolineaceae bacterium]|jgi:cytochrome d ubiquinol oxidase subunit I|nr:cytochrome ubiquinol oxidase subunit I [Longilinea sp.]HOU43304.1 cytochrome ubiquinol oxidase subunit I [Anaerolineaceae bacterium]HPA34017.1 cytochrome ubiquinol oxidase subunit I [Anaerolineaceae bacterium]HQF44747.1 cytochrome ubiquinol oxidase subunit I [Anaerolineaceae bacterium]HQH34783.1 cytochrome ubiquinol oxidase subunit I [Anaerolineaceae bacterium]
MENPTVVLSQWQFALTTIYHFFFVPLTLGLAILVAVLETIYVRTGQEVYKRMTQFWGKLFVINFAMGVVTGIVQEFQFGMNWSEYSRYVGDIFGAPLAIEALLAFFVESTFLGVWIFGWGKLSKKMHAATIWLVAIASLLSSLWILIANSFMQQPVGYAEENGRLVMEDFGALLTNPNVWLQFPHVIFSGLATGAFFMMGISAYHLLQKKEDDFFKKSFKLSAWVGLAASLLVILVGHSQAQHMVKTQPMKMAAAEALWETEDPASFSIFTIVDEKNNKDIINLRIPYGLSLLSYNSFSGEVRGILDLQREFEARHGPGDYIPSITITYWAFRIMVGAGFLMFGLTALAVLKFIQKRPLEKFRLLFIFPIAITLPYLANTAGWILTEMGRQPWVVYDKMKTADAVSPNITSGMVIMSLVGFTLIYGLLLFADVYLLKKYAKAGPASKNASHRTAEDHSNWE